MINLSELIWHARLTGRWPTKLRRLEPSMSPAGLLNIGFGINPVTDAFG